MKENKKEVTRHCSNREMKKHGISELVADGVMDSDTAQYLIEKAKTSSSIVVVGPCCTGKTTLLNALIDCIPKDKTGLVLQRYEELFTKKHPNMMFQCITSFSQNEQLPDRDYYIIGEICDKDTILYFLNACQTRHQAWCTLHGNSSTEGMLKLADYIKYASDYTQANVLQMLSALETVVFMKDFKVQEISEITGYDAKTGNLCYRHVFTRK